MKRHWKKILLGLLAVVFIVGGIVLYQFKFKEYDVADEEIEKITDEDYEIELPDGTTIGGDEDGEIEEGSESGGEGASVAAGDSSDGGSNGDSSSSEGSETVAGSGQVAGTSTSGAGDASVGGKGSVAGTSGGKGSSSGSAGSATGSGSGGGSGAGSAAPGGSSPGGQLSVAEIKGKYTPSFASLQSQANGRIDSLVGRALGEYNEKKNSGESISYGYFYQKYMGAANSLESQTDATFNKLIGALEGELQRNGYDKSYAQSFRDQYNSEKEARRNSIIKKAMNR